MARLLVGLILATGALLAGCAGPPDRPSPIDLPTPGREARPVPQPDGSVLFQATSERVAPNQPYRFTAFTHCGFTPTTFDFDGSFWSITSGPAGFVVAAGGGNPPEGIDNPSDRGLIILTDAGQAFWMSSRGFQFELGDRRSEVRAFGCD